MPDDANPPQPPRVILCLGQNCNADGAADPLYAQLQAVLNAHDVFDPPFTLRSANCLDMYEFGPNAVIHPGHIRCNGLDADGLAQVLDRYVFAEKNID